MSIDTLKHIKFRIEDFKTTLFFCLTILLTTVGYGQSNSINILFDNNLSSHIPHLEDDGFYYIDLCANDSLVLVVHGQYSNGTLFDDATATFTWDLNDTTITGIGRNSINYHFAAGIGYECAVNITDQNGQAPLSPFTFRIRTSRNPIADIMELPDICQGQPFDMTIGYDSMNYIRLQEIGNENITTLAVNDTVFLPDGKDCPPYGTSYRSPVTFTGFSENAIINDVNDIFYVRLNIEHSAVADIKIQLVCPNGQSTIILPDYLTTDWTTQYTPSLSSWPWSESYKAFNEMHLGEPYKAANNIEQYAGCDPADSPHGIGYNYIWSENTTQGYQYANSHNSYIYETDNLEQTNNPNYNGDYEHTAYTVKASHPENNTQFYKPYQSFANLVGCPMNGEWYIEIKDAMEDDNGYVFGWELALNPELIPDWSYTVAVDTTYIEGSGTNGTTITPDTAGNLSYTIHVLDEFGCIYDTVTSLFVQPILYSTPEDITICETENYQWQDEFYNSAGIYTDTLSSTATGCDSILTLNLNISHPTACLQTIPQQDIYEVGTNISFIDCSDAANYCCWDMGDKHLLTGPNITYAYTEAGTYTVTLAISDEFGCKDTTAQNIKIIDGFNLFFPNSFTPNNDGLNDEFKPIGLNIPLKGYELSIFNRFGQMIFHTINPNEGWDGTVNGKLVESLTIYSYILRYQNNFNQKHLKKGSIIVVY